MPRVGLSLKLQRACKKVFYLFLAERIELDKVSVPLVGVNLIGCQCHDFVIQSIGRVYSGGGCLRLFLFVIMQCAALDDCILIGDLT